MGGVQVQWKRATHRIPLLVWSLALLAMGVDLGRERLPPSTVPVLVVVLPAVLAAIAFVAFLRLLFRPLPPTHAPASPPHSREHPSAEV
jgi:hypothetical protein